MQGQTLGGWIVADPTLTAEGTFNTYAESDGVSALYPDNWGFQNESYGTLFIPQQGTGQSILLELANSLASYGAPGLPGYTQSSSSPVLVCGYTGTLSYYTKEASYTGATPPPLPVAREPFYAEIRFKIDSTHAMLIGFNYQNSSQLDRVRRPVQLASHSPSRCVKRLPRPRPRNRRGLNPKERRCRCSG